MSFSSFPAGDTQMTIDSVAPGTGIDLEFDTDG